MTGRTIYSQAIKEAAALIGAAVGFEIAINPKSAIDPDEQGDGVKLIGAIAKGASTILNTTLGGAAPYEIEHAATLTFFAFGGEEEDQDAALENAQILAATAILADPTLGGLVSDAAIGPPSDELTPAADSVAGAGLTMPVNFLYCAASTAG